MTEYEVTWLKKHTTRVSARNPDQARQLALEMKDTVLGIVKIDVTKAKTFRVSWIEHHECEVEAITGKDAICEAEYYAGEHNTLGDSDNYEVMEVD